MIKTIFLLFGFVLVSSANSTEAKVLKGNVDTEVSPLHVIQKKPTQGNLKFRLRDSRTDRQNRNLIPLQAQKTIKLLKSNVEKNELEGGRPLFPLKVLQLDADPKSEKFLPLKARILEDKLLQRREKPDIHRLQISSPPPSILELAPSVAAPKSLEEMQPSQTNLEVVKTHDARIPLKSDGFAVRTLQLLESNSQGLELRESNTPKILKIKPTETDISHIVTPKEAEVSPHQLLRNSETIEKILPVKANSPSKILEKENLETVSLNQFAEKETQTELLRKPVLEPKILEKSALRATYRKLELRPEDNFECLGKLRNANVEWDLWFAQFAKLAEPELINALEHCENSTGQNRVLITVWPDQRLECKIIDGDNQRFNEAILEAYAHLNGLTSLQFPDGSKRKRVEFEIINDHPRGGVSGIKSEAITGDRE